VPVYIGTLGGGKCDNHWIWFVVINTVGCHYM